MMPIWLHVFVVICLLISNALTFAIGLHWNRRLKRALDTRDVLLDNKKLDDLQSLLTMTSFE